MNKTLVFIGGVPGVGKTTVIECLKKDVPMLASWDPGDLFWQYHLTNPFLKTGVIESLVAKILKNLLPQTTLVNWHYAVFYSNRFIPHINWSCLKDIARKGKEIRFFFILLKAEPEEILKRRKKDFNRGAKKRSLDLNLIKKEVLKEEEYFQKELGIFKNLAPSSTRGVKINNDKVETTTAIISKLIGKEEDDATGYKA